VYGLGIAKGMLVVLRHLFRPVITRQYPEEPLRTASRFRGYDFALMLDRCTGNAACAKACPHGCIDIVTHRGTDGRYSIDKFDIDTGTCMVCGLCVEACPYDALFMGTNFALASYERWGLVVHKEEITSRERVSAYFRPPLLGHAAEAREFPGFYDPTAGLAKPAARESAGRE